MLMILIVGAVIPQYPHYHNYFILTVMVNIAWLMGAIGWMSAAAAWNPFLPEGPPWVSHAAPRGQARRAQLARRPAPSPTTTPTASIAQTPPTTKNPRWRTSPSPWRRRGIFSPGGRTPGRLARGVGAGAARASFPAPAEEIPFENDVGGVAMSATPTTGRRNAGGVCGGDDGGDGDGDGGGDGRGGDGGRSDGRARHAAESSEDAAPRALNFTSVPEDFKYDYAAHVARERAKARDDARAGTKRRARSRSPLLRGRWVRLPRTDARGAARARAGSPRVAASLRRRRSPRRDPPRRRVRRRGASPGVVRTPRDSGRRLDDVGEHDVVRADAAVSGARRGGRGEADRCPGGRPLAGTQVRRRIAGIAARRRHKLVNSPRRESTTRVIVCASRVAITCAFIGTTCRLDFCTRRRR